VGADGEVGYGRVGFEPFLKNFGDRLPPQALAIAERLADKIIAIEELFAKAPLTIAHGDLRYDNLYFGAEGMAVADWQIILRARDRTTSLTS
jgi:hypothetical protein